MTPDPTDAELDLIEAELRTGRPLVGKVGWAATKMRRLIKALRACRQEAKAKDAVLEEITKRPHSGDAAHPGPHGHKYCNCHVGIALAALDNLPSVAKQGETDDADS